MLLRRLHQATHFTQPVTLCVLAGLMVVQTCSSLSWHLEQRTMKTLVNEARQRQAACLELGLRWEAEDQEHQYGPDSSAGTHTTVGPISGFVMDVTEDEEGHAEGQCHAVNASYTDLLPRY